MFKVNAIYSVNFNLYTSKPTLFIFLGERNKKCYEFYSITRNLNFIIPDNELRFYTFEEVI